MMQPRSPFEGLELVEARAEGLVITELRRPGICWVRARRGRLASFLNAADRLGLALADAPCCAMADGLVMAGIAPETWLAIEEGAQFRLAGRLSEVFEETAWITDQSDAYAVLTFDGARVKELLAKGVALDLDDASLRPGDAAATKLGHLAVSLWRLDNSGAGEPRYMLAAPRSYVSDLHHWLSASTASLFAAAGRRDT